MRDGPAGGRLRSMHAEAIHPAVRVGHVHLRVADRDRARAF
jgi:catechol-2,3-dioxygenase